MTLPERRYDLAGQVMAQAITDATRHGLPPEEALRRAAHNRRRALGERARDVAGTGAKRATVLAAAGEVLAEYGYQPHWWKVCSPDWMASALPHSWIRRRDAAASA